jgi:hypothetical protein
MKRLLISVCGGIAITLSLALVGALILNRGVGDGFIALLLYGPAILIESLGIDLGCANADSIAEKLSCMRLYLIIDIFAYPLIICACSYLVYVMLFGRAKRVRLP